MRNAKLAWLILAIVQISIAACSHAQPPAVVGSWKVEITFAHGESRSLRFDAQDGGKGSFRRGVGMIQLLVQRTKTGVRWQAQRTVSDSLQRCDRVNNIQNCDVVRGTRKRIPATWSGP